MGWDGGKTYQWLTTLTYRNVLREKITAQGSKYYTANIQYKPHNKENSHSLSTHSQTNEYTKFCRQLIILKLWSTNLHNKTIWHKKAFWPTHNVVQITKCRCEKIWIDTMYMYNVHVGMTDKNKKNMVHFWKQDGDYKLRRAQRQL